MTTINDVSKFITQAIHKAAKDYWNMTGGYTLGDGHESYLHTKIAEYIYKKGDNLFCAIELNRTQIEDQNEICKNSRAPIKLRHFPEKGRVDIAVWNTAGLKYFIEVKTRSECDIDEGRMAAISRDNSQITTYCVTYKESKKEPDGVEFWRYEDDKYYTINIVSFRNGDII